MIDGFYREETRLQENSARLKAAQNALVEVSEVGEEADDVLKPESLEDSSPTKPLYRRRWGRRRRRLKIAKPVSSSSSIEPRKRRPYRRRNRSELLLLSSPRPSYEKRQRKIPRGFDDYESFFDTSRPTEDEDTGDSVACFACGKSFLPTTLEAHVRQIHRLVKNLITNGSFWWFGAGFPKDQCYICGKFFPTADNARIHIKTAHYGIYNYKCPECDKGYYYYLKLVRHLRSLHQCDCPPSREECRVDGTYLNNAIVDLDSRELRENECRCLVCLSIFPIIEMDKHMNERHRDCTCCFRYTHYNHLAPSKQAFPRTRCYVCGQRFSSLQEVSEHLDSTHLKQSMFTCPECETGFDELQEWRDHMEKIHQSDGSGSVFAMRNDFRAEKTTLQEECDRQKRLIAEAEAKAAEVVAAAVAAPVEPETKAPETAADGQNEPEEDSSLNNPECNEPSTLVSGRNNVMEYEYELTGGYENPQGETDEVNGRRELLRIKIFFIPATGGEVKGQKKAINIDFFAASSVDVCPVCKKVLHTKKSLKTHIEAIHHKMKRYACNLCDRSFYARCDLRKHVDCVHNRLKTYSCNECGRRFFLHSQLASHLVNHHKAVLPFKCNECGRRYAIKQVLNDHVWRFHTGKFVLPTQMLIASTIVLTMVVALIVIWFSSSLADKPKRIRINGRLVTPNPSTMPRLVQALSPSKSQRHNQSFLTTHQLSGESVEPTEVAIVSDNGDVKEVFLIGNQLYYAENVAFQATGVNADTNPPYETIQLDSVDGGDCTFSHTTVTLQSEESDTLGGFSFDQGYTALTTGEGESLHVNSMMVNQLPVSITEEVNCKTVSVGNIGPTEVDYFTYPQS
ncbi:unnamed protein product [Hydatigera taeniaeformis]|uniref:C2H2-type domain-containing protein n=1 Tax=Hydatigena taeniaeformis TaxID=6205 RepID=A0A0R3X790_HYDTA|nr:unnamed protein product [Hydatigera taeniaeformis]